MKFIVRTAFVLLAMSMAVSSANLDIPEKDFSLTVPLVTGSGIPLLPEIGTKILPEKPSTLEPGWLYLRRKVDGNSYAWYKGRPTTDAFGKLRKFTAMGETPKAFLQTKFYATRIAKPFQDEADVYFDMNGVYSLRVPKLYFVQADQWVEILGQVVGAGSIKIASNIKARVQLDGITLGDSPLDLTGISAGWHTVLLESDSTLPTVQGIWLKDGETVPLMSELTKFVKPSLPDRALLMERKPVAPSTILADLAQLKKGLMDAEASLRKEFSNSYPKMQDRPMSLPKSEPAFQYYEKAYYQAKAQAESMLFSSFKEYSDLIDSLMKKETVALDSLLAIPVKSKVNLLATKSVDSLQVSLMLRSTDGTIDVGWMGVWNDTTLKLDSLAMKLADTASGYFLQVEYLPRPVELRIDTLRSQRYYRYLKLELVSALGTKPLPGKFLLPLYIQDIPEVQAWLFPPKAPDIKKPTVVAKDSTSKPTPKVVDDTKEISLAWRGDVVEIPGGVFRYSGKLVQISPFAIHRTEVTQAHYQRLTLGNPATRKKGQWVGLQKPVHSVNWDEALEFCEKIGGTLPTEAQWEFAARAGGNVVELWKAEEKPQPASNYAVFARRDGPMDVGSLRPNAYGLVDVHGNVAEWTKDSHSWFSFYVESKDPTGSLFGADRIFKGGSWQSGKEDELNLTIRDYEDPRYWWPNMGFRCAFPALQVLDINDMRKKLADVDAQAGKAK